ncbi:hypothetical protein [Streptomyces halobius]|uniref:Uncharacterized protein n=1 Tax=Streptomyces halobius TaxID=2879846 RepID=A0ABY4MHT0_9ACTN|nr:hypothetical protein [Streptomyces halobius]UQA97298.1 hypothetical protein K9S39_40415 [Streptomyces halobius]
MTVSFGAGVSIAAASPGVVMIYGPEVVPLVAPAASLALAANRSHLRCRAVRRR